MLCIDGVCSFSNVLWKHWSRGRSTSLATRLQAGRPGFDSRQEQGYFSLRHCVQTSSGAHPASHPVGTGVLSSGVNRPRHEVDLSPPCIEVTNVWSYNSTPPYVFMVSRLVKHRENFIFALLENIGLRLPPPKCEMKWWRAVVTICKYIMLVRIVRHVIFLRYLITFHVTF
jgi:hypothetical protein